MSNLTYSYTYTDVEHEVEKLKEIAKRQNVDVAVVASITNMLARDRQADLQYQATEFYEHHSLLLKDTIMGLGQSIEAGFERLANATEAVGLDIHNEAGYPSLGKCVLELATALDNGLLEIARELAAQEKAPPVLTDEAH